MSTLSEYGTVTSKQISAEDVSNKHFDLQVRINNAEKLRQRLLLLAQRDSNLEDALKVEKELARVTAELEKLKGLLNAGKEKVHFASLVIEFYSPAPEPKVVYKVPFSWVNQLALNLRNPKLPKAEEGSWLNRKIKADMPSGFATYYNKGNNLCAMNGQGGHYHIALFKNQAKDGGVKFWSQLISKYLESARGMKVISSKKVKTDSGEGFQIKAAYGSSIQYFLQVVPGDDNILVSELWGSEKDIAKDTDALFEKMKDVNASL